MKTLLTMVDVRWLLTLLTMVDVCWLLLKDEQGGLSDE